MVERKLYFKLINEGTGGFLNPPGDAEHTFCLASSYRRAIGPNSDRMSLRCALETEWVPNNVKEDVRNLLAAHPGDVKSEKWQRDIYNYFTNCYSPDDIDRSTSKCEVINEPLLQLMMTPEKHLGYLFIKKFDPDHTPRLDLINRDWNKTPKIEGERWARSPKQKTEKIRTTGALTMASKLVHVVTKEDVGKNFIQKPDCKCCGAKGPVLWLVDVCGRILKGDVGKRIYKVLNDAGDSSILQIESDEQLKRRLSRNAKA